MRTNWKAYYAATLAFQGTGETTIQQMLFYGAVNVDCEQDATSFDGQGTPVYHKAADCWAYQPFCDNPISGTSPLDESNFTGFAAGTNAYQVSLGTGANSAYGDGTNVAYIVADGDVQWSGTICRNGVMYDVSGTTAGQ